MGPSTESLPQNILVQHIPDVLLRPEPSVIWRIKTGGVQNETLLPSQRRQRHHVASHNKKLNSKMVIARCSTHRQVTSQYQALGFLN